MCVCVRTHTCPLMCVYALVGVRIRGASHCNSRHVLRVCTCVSLVFVCMSSQVCMFVGVYKSKCDMQQNQKVVIKSSVRACLAHCAIKINLFACPFSTLFPIVACPFSTLFPIVA